MAKFKSYGNWIHWPIGDALRWRMQFGCSIEQAVKELCLLMRQEPKDFQRDLFVTGVFVRSHPARPVDWNFPPREFLITPSRLAPGAPHLGRTPGDHWDDLEPVVDADEQPTNALRWVSVKLIAWKHVECDQDRLIIAWMPLIEKSVGADQAASLSPPIAKSIDKDNKRARRDRAINDVLDRLENPPRPDLPWGRFREEVCRAAGYDLSANPPPKLPRGYGPRTIQDRTREIIAEGKQ